MLELIKINIQNLASIKEQSYYFNKELATIVGINKDTSNIPNSNISDSELIQLPLINLKSNGSGKTTIIEALHICLLGNCIREKINLRDLIRKGESSMKIELVCKNEHLGLSQIRIIREIFADKNKTSKVEIFETKDKEEYQIPKTSAEGMDFYILNNYIGLSKEDIDNFFIIQGDRFKSFLELPDSKKKEILARFTGISGFNFVEEELNKELIDWDNKKTNKNIILSRDKGQKDAYLSILEEFPKKEEFERRKEERIEELNKKIQEKKDIISCKKSSIKEFENKIEQCKKDMIFWEGRQDKYNKYIATYSITEIINDLKKEREGKEKELKEIEEVIISAKNLRNDNRGSLIEIEIAIDGYKTLLKNLVECPHCHFKFSVSSEESEQDIKEHIKSKENNKLSFENKVKEIEEDLESLNNLLKIKEKEIEDIVFKISKTRNKQLKINHIGDFINNEISQIEHLVCKLIQEKIFAEDSIKSIEKSIEEIYSQIDSIKNEDFDSIIEKRKKYETKIKELEEDIKKITKETDEIDKQTQLIKDSILNYGLFKNYLYNKIIFEIEHIVNSYLSQFSDLRVSIKGSKVLADGKSIRDEINCSISRQGEEISYFLLSSGEKSFINVSFILTFQKILNITSNNGFNFLILDEITGKVDCANQEELLKAIKLVDKPILFITHIPTISDFNTTYIIKENNISRILQ